MKVYTNTIDLSKPMERKFWVAPFSDFGIGVKFVNGDSDVDGVVTLKDKDGNTLTAEENKINGFTIYKMNSGEGEKTVTYTAVAPNGQETIIIQNVSDSTVFDTDETGGGVPSDLTVDSIVVGDSTNITEINSSKFESKIYDQDFNGSLTIESTVSPGFRITKVADGMQPASLTIDPTYPAIIIQGNGVVPGYWDNDMAMFTPRMMQDISGNNVWVLACEHRGE